MEKYNLYFDFCALLVSGFTLIFFILRKGLRSRKSYVFGLFIGSQFLAAAAELISLFMRNDPAVFDLRTCNIASWVFLNVHNAAPFLFIIYVMYLLRLEKRIPKWQWAVAALPEIVNFVCLTFQPLKDKMYFFEDGITYTHGPLFDIVYVTTAVYVLVGLFLLFRYRGGLKNNELMAMLAMIGLCVIPLPVQVAFRKLKITLFIQSLGALGAFLTVEDETYLVDVISGMYTRGALLDRIPALYAGDFAGTLVTVKLLHIEYLKMTLGMDTMTAMIRRMGSYVKHVTGGSVRAYHFGDGKIAILFEKERDEEIDGIVAEIQRRFELPFTVKEVSAVFPAEIDVIDIPEKASTREQLMAALDLPVDDSLPATRVVYPDQMNDYERSVRIEQAVWNAVDHNLVQVYYQPIFSTKENAVCSAEALVRIEDAELGLLNPEEFIPIAEKNGSVVLLGQQVFEKVCRFIAKEKPEEAGIDFFEVNLSTVQCMNPDLAEEFTKILKKYDISADWISLEITESALIHNEALMEKTVGDLKKEGFSFALDDYGTGYSNFTYMMKYPFSIFKLDKSILHAAEEKHGNESILNHVIKMAGEMGMKVVTEGVETEEEKRLLTEVGADYLQGYYFSIPVSEDDFLNTVKEINARFSNES